MADEGPLIALVGSAIPRDDRGKAIDDPKKENEAKIRTACKALGRELAATSCRLIVYSSDPRYIEADVVSGYAEIAKTPGCIQFVRPKDDHKNFTEQDRESTRLLFHVQRGGSPDWEGSFFQSLKQADGVLLVSGGVYTLVGGHVAMSLGRPVAPIGAFGGMAGELRNYLTNFPSNLTPELADNEKQALSEFVERDDAAVTVVAGLKRRCEEVAASRRKRDEEEQQLKADLQAAQRQLAQRQNADQMERQVRWGAAVLGVMSLVLLVIGLGIQLSRVMSIALFMVVLATGGGLGACLRLTRPPSAGKPFTAMVFGAIAGAVFSLSYMLPHWMSNQTSNQADPFALGTTPSAQLRLVMTWLVALGGGLAADAVIDSLRRGAEQRALELNPAAPAGPSAAGAKGEAAAPGGREKNTGRS